MSKTLRKPVVTLPKEPGPMPMHAAVELALFEIGMRAEGVPEWRIREQIRGIGAPWGLS